ncbi:MAG: hypothetical protein K2G12_09860 [Prevotella sp.]|nr:hypothetical protein [Prevotella sp.]
MTDKSFFKFSEFFRNCTDREIKDALDDLFVSCNLFNLYCVLSRIRYRVGVPMIINSGFRSFDHNTRVGGVPVSQHLVGSAVDVRKSRKLCEYFNSIKNSQSELFVAGIYQLIEYDGFYHIGIFDDEHPSDTYPSVYIDKTTTIKFE